MRVLLTGATGVVGAEVRRLLEARAELRCVARQAAPGVVSWCIGREAAPADLGGRWDVIVHTAASTRWTMSRTEAATANVEPLRAVLDLADPDTHVVHVSTAYVGTADPASVEADPMFDGYRNGYEWSKARCEEELLARHQGAVTVVRPPLILGRMSDGAIERFSGPYTLLQALVSGLAAAVVGEPGGFAEIAPVDLVAAAVANAALERPPEANAVVTVAAGKHCLQLASMVELLCGELNAARARVGASPIDIPPMVSLGSWRRFYMPLAEEYLSPMQHEAVRLLGMFETYTSMASPFEADLVVEDPSEVIVRSVRYWAQAKPRLLVKTPKPWSLVG
jgi:nucleoside-diphosphate-sugar epimerase